jgi:hypothetical protein
VNIPHRAALVQEQVGQAGTPALHVRAVRAGEVLRVGDPIESRTARLLKLSKVEPAERRTTAKAFSAKSRTEPSI